MRKANSALPINHGSYEIIRAYRQFHDTDWLHELAYHAWEIAGIRANVIESSEPPAVELINPREATRVTLASGRLGGLSMRLAAKRARREARGTLRSALTASPSGLFLSTTVTQDGSVPTIGIDFASSDLDTERDRLITGVNVTAKHCMPWDAEHKPNSNALEISEPIPLDRLNELRGHLPQAVLLEPGVVGHETAQITPLSSPLQQ